MKLYLQCFPSFRVVLILFLLFTNPLNNLFAEIRYVSKTGSSTPPYLSWETAADSIQEAINICQFGDTIYVGNGVYKEQVIMIPGLSLIGAGADSCVIDTREFPVPRISINLADTCNVSGFFINVSPVQNSSIGIYFYRFNGQPTIGKIENNIIINSGDAIRLWNSNMMVNNNLIQNSEYGISLVGGQPLIKNNIFTYCAEAIFADISRPWILNNTIIIGTGEVAVGYSSGFESSSHLYNNLFIATAQGNGIVAWDEEFMYNNVFIGIFDDAIITQNEDSIINNIIINAQNGIDYAGGYPPVSTIRFNNFWNTQNISSHIVLDSTNMQKYPMFVNEDSLDFHLQMFSPMIDAGDPSILDLDSSRSDLGIFGGPYGEKYTYNDLAPRPPIGLEAISDTDYVILKWRRNSEADFSYYNIFRDTVSNFPVDSTTFILSTADSFYTHLISPNITSYYYKVTAVDSQGNESDPSEEINIVTDVNEEPIISYNYKLFQNYPNPFNPSTSIGYRLKERSYVKIYIYSVTGEIINVFVNELQEGGYHEKQFNPEALSSGIYFYTIEAENENNIPVFRDMKKMIYVK